MAIRNRCPLCDRECKTDWASGAATIYNCSSCGEFVATYPAEINLSNMSADNKLRVAACTRERNIRRLPNLWLLSGEPDNDAPDGAYSVEHALETLFPTRIQDRFDRALSNLCKLTRVPGEAIQLSLGNDLSVIFAESVYVAKFILTEMMDLKYIDKSLDSKTSTSEPYPPFNVIVRAAGFNRMQQIEDSESREKSTQAFVAMWFDEGLYDAFKNGIEPAVRDCGFKPLRIDNKETNQKICDEIIAEIRQSKFLIADFTGARGGVYFEAGFAMGLGIPVIWTCKKDEIGDLHFDTRQYSHVVWEGVSDLRNALRNRIAATIPGAKKTW